MGKLLEQAKLFRAAFQCESKLDSGTLEMQSKLIDEEKEELSEELWSLKFDVLEAETRKGQAVQAEDLTREGSTYLLKEMADLVFVVYQLAAYLGWDLDEAMDRVFESNMSKLVDGTPLRREDGKVLKGPNYRPPSLSDLVQ